MTGLLATIVPLAPLAKVEQWGPSAQAVAALVLGGGFGFFLEKAGFGNSRVLAGQWYGYNFAVLRVMFTAIVVAMLGLFGLSALGAVDFSLVYINEAYLWPQVVGGLIFGFGFVIGQYCPGTALVGCATGKLDAMAFVGGFFAGLVGFIFAFPLFARFYGSSALGRVLLPEALHVSTGIVVVAVVVVALGAFALTHVLDRKLGNRPGGGPLFGRRAGLFAAVLVLLAAGVALRSAGGVAPLKLAVNVPRSALVTPAELADWIIEGRRDFTLVDLREAAQYEAGHVRGAVHCGTCHESRAEGRRTMDDHFVDLSKQLVLYTQTGKEPLELPKMLAQNPSLRVLDGGYDAWRAAVLAPASAVDENDPGQRELQRRREAVRSYFAGETAGTARPAPLPVAPIRREGAHQPAAAHEGC